MSHPLLAAEAGVRHLLLGNEAIVRGALEAGINVVTCYPGTPSSEIPDTFHYLASCGRYRMEYSVNEKVAVEVGAGAALASTAVEVINAYFADHMAGGDVIGENTLLK